MLVVVGLEVGQRDRRVLEGFESSGNLTFCSSSISEDAAGNAYEIVRRTLEYCFQRVLKLYINSMVTRCN